MGLPRSGRSAAGRRSNVDWSVVLFALVPLTLTLTIVGYLLAHDQLAFDFRREYWVAGSRLLHGGDLYAWTRAQIYNQTAFAYPAPAAFALAPFALLPSWLGAAAFSLLCLIAVAGTLHVLAVRDWRLYGLVLLWQPVVAGWQSANLTLPLTFGLALVWRFRDRGRASGLIAAAMIALKPFLWPVALWLAATRRLRATLWCCAGVAAANLIAWAIVGPSQVHAYVSLARRVADDLYRRSYGIPALAAQLGLSLRAGEALLIVVSLALVLLCVRVGIRDERHALALCVLLTLTATPLLDTHYLALLIVPLAIARPTLSGEWLVPLALWACPESTTAGWQAFFAWAVIAVVVYRLLRAPAPRQADAQRLG